MMDNQEVMPWRRALAAMRALPGPVRGVAWMLVSAAASGSMNGLIRYLSAEIHAFEIAFFRNAFGFLVLVPLILRAGLGSLRTQQFHRHALRGVLNAFAMLSFFLALGITPLATVVALGFTGPLIATLLAAIILGERIGPERAGALALGFLGAVTIVRPGLVAVSPGEMLVLVSTLAWSAALIVIKVMSRTESSITITAYAGFFLTPITFVCALPFWSWPDATQLLLLLAIGMFGSLTQVGLAQAFKEAEATQVMPADFTKLIWAALIGYLAFAEIPDVWTLLGSALILGGVAHLTLMNARRRRPA